VTFGNTTQLRDALLAHYRAQKRDLPWRKSADPYAIWVSEVMLQQTRVETVIPYFERFMRAFPTVKALSEASEQQVLAQWSGLGYYRRARMLHAGAAKVVQEHGGVVPSQREALLALPGVGAYTAGAIASIAFGLCEPVLDGNVERVLSRVTALRENPRENPHKAKLWALASQLAQGPDPGALNQALMELGATICLPLNPQCLLCPARPHCAGFATTEPTQFPALPKKKPPRDEHWLALLVRGDGNTALLVEPAQDNDRFRGMLVPPLVAVKSSTLDDTRVRSLLKQKGYTYLSTLATLTHILTHAKMHFTVCLASPTAKRTDRKNPAQQRARAKPPAPAPTPTVALKQTWVDPDQLDALPIPTVTKKLLALLPKRE
jgi:A/G-specific adenine glycosylase